MATIPERNWLNIQWLARLRWAEIAGQAVTVFAGQFLLAGKLPITALLGVIAVGLVSNIFVETYFFGGRRRGDASPKPVHEWQLALVMMLDIALLTGLLYLTGGPYNPFAFLYLVQIALAAVLVRARWTWMLVGCRSSALASCCRASAARDSRGQPRDDRRVGRARRGVGVRRALPACASPARSRSARPS